LKAEGFLKSKVIGIGIAIVIGPDLQRFTGIVIRDEIPYIIGRKIADDDVSINSQPCLYLTYQSLHGKQPRPGKQHRHAPLLLAFLPAELRPVAET
jgi:hypothetical protein